MMVFRGCVKCQGDLYVERNIDGADLVCLQCGSRKTIHRSRLTRPENRRREWRLQHAHAR
jgi:hypothetical protein